MGTDHRLRPFGRYPDPSRGMITQGRLGLWSGHGSCPWVSETSPRTFFDPPRSGRRRSVIVDRLRANACAAAHVSGKPGFFSAAHAAAHSRCRLLLHKRWYPFAGSGNAGAAFFGCCGGKFLTRRAVATIVRRSRTAAPEPKASHRPAARVDGGDVHPCGSAMNRPCRAPCMPDANPPPAPRPDLRGHAGNESSITGAAPYPCRSSAHFFHPTK